MLSKLYRARSTWKMLRSWWMIQLKQRLIKMWVLTCIIFSESVFLLVESHMSCLGSQKEINTLVFWDKVNSASNLIISLSHLENSYSKYIISRFDPLFIFIHFTKSRWMGVPTFMLILILFIAFLLVQEKLQAWNLQCLYLTLEFVNN